jgi:S-adenosylmethionine decarboxylase
MEFQQYLVSAYECESPLDDADFLKETLISSVRIVKAHIVNSLTHQYVPHGLTVVLLLAESHVMVSTWPEYHYAYVDIFLCDRAMSPGRVWLEIERSLRPKQTKVHEINHDIVRPGAGELTYVTEMVTAT